MFDVSSDLDGQNHNGSLLEESSDSHMLAEARCDQLQEENSSLIRQNNVLRAQFEQAVAISKNAALLHKEIDDLKAKLFECSTQRDDLKNRLEISVHSQEEAQKQLIDEHERNAAQRKADVSAMQKELSKVQRNYQSRLDKLYAANEELQRQMDADEVSQKTLVGRIDKAVLNASRFFGRQVTSFDELCGIIEGEPIQISQETTSTEPRQDEIKFCQMKKLEEAQKRVKKTKKELKLTLKKLAETQDELQKEKREAEKTEFKHEAEIRELKDKISQISEEKSLGDADRDHKISMLVAKIETLKEELAKKKAAVIVSPPKAVVEKKPVLSAKKIQEKVEIEEKFTSDDKFINEQLTARIEELSSQLKSATAQNEELKKKCEESEQKINSLIISHESEHNELNALKTIHNETVNEVETMRAALYAKQEKTDKKEKSRRRKEQQRIANTITQLENNNEELKKQLYEVQLENQNAIQQAKEQKDRAERVEAEKESIKEQVSRLSMELGDARQRLADIVPLTEEDFIPKSAWTSNDFESALAQQIAKISANNTLHPASKLQQIYRTINKYFTKKIDATKEAANESNEEKTRMFAFMNDFIVSLSIALNDKATSFEDFLQCKEIGSELVNNVTTLRATITELIHTRDYLQNAIENIGATFGITDCSDICARMTEVRSELDTQMRLQSKQLKKAKSVRAELEELKAKYSEEREEREKTEMRLKSTLESVSETNKALTETNKKLKTDLASMKHNVEDLEEKVEYIENKNSEDAEEMNESHNNQIQSIKQEYTETIEHLTNELSKANQTIAEADSHINKYKSVVSAQKATIQDNKSELQAAKQQFEIRLKKRTDRHCIEKKQLIESYEKAIKELSEECDKQGNDVIALSNEISKRDKRVKELKATVTDLKRENAKLEKEGKLREEEFQRENKIAQSAIKGAAMSAESQYTAKLSEHKLKWEAEKRRILSYVAEELRQFFDANNAIDEKSFRTIISKAKEEINRLQRTDIAIRRMVGATGRQTTDDAVAQLVINTK